MQWSIWLTELAFVGLVLLLLSPLFCWPAGKSAASGGRHDRS